MRAMVYRALAEQEPDDVVGRPRHTPDLLLEELICDYLSCYDVRYTKSLFETESTIRTTRKEAKQNPEGVGARRVELAELVGVAPRDDENGSVPLLVDMLSKVMSSTAADVKNDDDDEEP